jgi:hypothetical protein
MTSMLMTIGVTQAALVRKNDRRRDMTRSLPSRQRSETAGLTKTRRSHARPVCSRFGLVHELSERLDHVGSG